MVIYSYVAVRYTVGAFKKEVRAEFVRVRPVSIHPCSVGVLFGTRDLGIIYAVAVRVLLKNSNKFVNFNVDKFKNLKTYCTAQLNQVKAYYKEKRTVSVK